jgi:hypothetical protein
VIYPGWREVDKLADALVRTKGLSITPDEVTRITQLYNSLSDYDKQPLMFAAKVDNGKYLQGNWAKGKGKKASSALTVTKR